MPTLRIALAQVDPTVGDLAGNVALVRGWTRKAAESGAHLVAFPEMVLTGYPVEDLAGYVTDKTLSGLFTVVGEQEKQIRTNPAARATDLLKQVFGN